MSKFNNKYMPVLVLIIKWIVLINKIDEKKNWTSNIISYWLLWES